MAFAKAAGEVGGGAPVHVLDGPLLVLGCRRRQFRGDRWLASSSPAAVREKSRLKRRLGLGDTRRPTLTTPHDRHQSLSSLGAGHVLGRYELLMPVASGGMAMVWAARLKGSHGFQKIVAIKTMLPVLSEDDQFEKMFLDEAALASNIHHPHVVEILDLGEESGVLFLVMEWIDGVAVNQLMKGARAAGGVPLPVASRIVMQACAGLHAAHELKGTNGELIGLVHRDVSPQNILVTFDGVAKVVDFGVAKATARGGGATQAGQVKGKIAYMAPEQNQALPLDRRADVFALGIVLYAMATGKHPFRRETEAATMYNIASAEPVVPPHRLVEGFPPELEAVILKALQKDPSLRFASASDMLRALDQLPPSQRASTDEEVALFVRQLFEERRRVRQQALDEAIEHLNLNPNAPTNWAAMEQPGPSGIHSGVSLVTRPSLPSGVRDSLTTMSELSGGSKGRLALILGGAILAAGAVGGGVVALLNGKSSAPATPGVTSTTITSTVVITAVATAAPSATAAASLDSLAVEGTGGSAGAAADNSGGGSSKVNAGSGTPPSVTATATAKTTTGAKSGGKGGGKSSGGSWKNDPGF